MSFQRARNEDQVEERRANILATAKKLCAESGVMGWSLNELGRRASINKSNLYRYFGSREEALMMLLLDEMTMFVEDFDNRVKEKKQTVKKLSGDLVKSYVAHPFFCELLSIASAILEHNVAVEPIVEIKRSILALTQRHAISFSDALDWMSDEQAAQTSSMIGVFVSGLWPIANPSESVQEISKLTEFECLIFSFEDQLLEFTTSYLVGIQKCRS